MSNIPRIKIVQPDGNVQNTPKFFNSYFEESDTWCVFLGHNIKCNNEERLLQQVKSIIAKYPEISGIYTDIVLGDICYKVLYQSYYFNIADKFTMNAPIICNTDITIRFDEDRQDGYYHDFISRLSKKYLLWHIPEPSFTVPHNHNVMNI